MKPIVIAVLLAFSLLMTISCKKQSGKNAVDITGTWSFVSMNVNGTTTTESLLGSETDKSVMVTRYTTDNNTGSITFDGSRMTCSNLSYSVISTSESYLYLNDILTDSFAYSFNFISPVINESVTYQTAAADSIYFGQGSVFMNGVTKSTTPAGARINLSGNVLTLTQSVNEDSTAVTAGVTVNTSIRTTEIIQLQRQ